MKHGMLTVRPPAGDETPHGADKAPAQHGEHGKSGEHAKSGERAGTGILMLVILFTVAALFAGLWLAGGFFD